MTISQAPRPTSPGSLVENVSPSTGRWGPRRGGPYPYLRLDLGIKATQGFAVFERVMAGASFRQAAAALDLSVTTAWRRHWWFIDWMQPEWHGRPPGPIPPQRGTRACPRGRPYLPTLDGPPDLKRSRRKGSTS
ncbi:hypothetical protein [Streptomyces liliifuscus]|uniref:Uncharacterized protein n=1 Tax=Streptomyces liliifuscus TaxID=2797636 RepID=A0A7T7KX90_9ACTN|nr:hypothetical protein [Streptomyces liliifuscus]QQM41987.1 hypothetical protein JEQ17_22770 [Streptomyces liliifuscus]